MSKPTAARAWGAIGKAAIAIVMLTAGICQANAEKESYAKSMSGGKGHSYTGAISGPSSQAGFSSSGSSSTNSYASSMSSSGTSYINQQQGTSYAGAIGTTNSSQRVRLGRSTGGSLLGIMNGSPRSSQNVNFSSQVKRPSSMVGGSLLNTMGASSRTSSYSAPVTSSSSKPAATKSKASTSSKQGAATATSQSSATSNSNSSVFTQLRKKHSNF